MEKLFVACGHTVRLVSDGRQALNLANGADFDLLLLDLHMPELDGFGVIQSLREREQTSRSHLPVIALTARSRKEDRERCLAAGMDDFLSKPIQTDDLWATIDRVMAAFPSTPRRSLGLLDPRVLLSSCGGDDEILRSICDGLRATLPTQLTAIQDAFSKTKTLPRFLQASPRTNYVGWCRPSRPWPAALRRISKITPLAASLKRPDPL